jgi:hypothetical protein
VCGQKFSSTPPPTNDYDKHFVPLLLVLAVFFVGLAFLSCYIVKIP